MRKRTPRIVILVLLAAGSVLTAASPVWAEGCEGGSCTGFERDEYWVAEGAVYVELHVYAAWCCPVGQGAIDYHTSDLTAVAGRDYQQTSGTLTYTGHGGNLIRVPIIQDGSIEDEERFEVKLTNFRGSFVNRGRETAVVRIVDDDPKQSLGSSASSGGSNQQTEGSHAGSSAPPPSQPSAVAESSESTDAGSQSGEVNPDDPTRKGEPPAGGEAEQAVGKTGRDDNQSSSFLPAILGTLLIVTIAVVGFWSMGSTERRSDRVA
jgi:hypothetical protein